MSNEMLPGPDIKATDQPQDEDGTKSKTIGVNTSKPWNSIILINDPEQAAEDIISAGKASTNLQKKVYAELPPTPTSRDWKKWQP